MQHILGIILVGVSLILTARIIIQNWDYDTARNLRDLFIVASLIAGLTLILY